MAPMSLLYVLCTSLVNLDTFDSPVPMHVHDERTGSTVEPFIRMTMKESMATWSYHTVMASKQVSSLSATLCLLLAVLRRYHHADVVSLVDCCRRR